MKLKQILVVCLLFTQMLLNGQTATIYQEAKDHQITLKLNDLKKESPSHTVLELVSKTKGDDGTNKSVRFNVVEHREIIKTGNRADASIAIGNYVLEGNYSYQKFLVNDLLTPELCVFSYTWKGTDGKTLSETSNKTIKFKSGVKIVALRETYSPLMDNSEIKLDAFTLKYSEKDAEKLESFFNSVDDYYNFDARLNMMNSELDKIRYDTLELLDDFLQVTVNNIKTINTIKAKRLNSKLRLDLNDPIRFKTHLGQTEVRNRDIKKNLERTMSNMHEAYYKKGLDWLKWGNKKKARSFFEKSIHTKPNYAPPHYELARYTYAKNNFRGTLDSCRIIIHKMNPDNDTRYNTLKLAENCIFQLIDSTKTYSTQGNFKEAFKTLDYAKSYAQSIEGFRQFPEFDELYTSLYKKLYQFIAAEAETQIENSQLRKAQKTVDSLTQFRLSHQEFYINPEQEHNLLKSLYAAWIKTGKEELKKNNADSAVYAFTHARIICKTHEVVYCDENLANLLKTALGEQYLQQLNAVNQLITNQQADSALQLLKSTDEFRKTHDISRSFRADTLYFNAKQLKHNQLVDNGIKAQEHNQSEKALENFEKAAKIHRVLKIQRHPELDSLLVSASINCILQFCTEGETYAEAMQLAQARNKLAKSEILYQQYKLTDDVEATKAIAQLKEMLNQGECGKANFNFNIQLNTAEKFIKNKDFKHAKEAYNKAVGIATSNSTCMISDSFPKARLKEMEPILMYQQKIEDIERLVNNKAYAAAIEEYKQASTYFMDSCEHTFGLSHKNLDSFIIEHENGGILDFAIRYYVGKERINQALLLLKELYSREYISKWSKRSQIALGMQLAKRDYEKDPTKDPRLKVLDYTKDDNWYKYLRKGYLKQWKKL